MAEEMEEVKRAINILRETCCNAGILITSTTVSSDSTTLETTSAIDGSTSTALHLSGTRPHVIKPHPLQVICLSHLSAQHVNNVSNSHIISIPVLEHKESRPLNTFSNAPEPTANISPNTEAITPSSPSIEYGFDAARLEKARSLRKKKAKDKRYFQTLQCIREAGSSRILGSLRAVTSAQANIKNADSLTKTSGVPGCCKPHSHCAKPKSYGHPSPDDKIRIERNMTVFLKQGKKIHLILQGFYLSRGGQVGDGGGEEAGTELYAGCAALLLFLPGKTKTSPDVSSCVKDEVIRRRLQKGIQVQDIDNMSESEAQWFGKALRILRPELLGTIPERGMKFLMNSIQEEDDLREQDPEEFQNKPLDFLA
ncbi:hypothetical protein EJ02DRAFT_468520 [Clathrospora elynae]|uniref:Uncharacterized protein n=1 Tax=Clathrospora elynae TaxID=706981 RepID=A0A6A5SE53_9PLEO|nr:hypothetical protein EJ02DRAFT_468520 [Clathrospora elynae]